MVILKVSGNSLKQITDFGDFLKSITVKGTITDSTLGSNINNAFSVKYKIDDKKSTNRYIDINIDGFDLVDQTKNLDKLGRVITYKFGDRSR